MCVKPCDLNPSLLFLNLSLQSHSWVDELFCFSQAHLIHREKKSVYGLWLNVSSFLLLPPSLRVGDLKGRGVLKMIQVACVSS